MFLRRHVWTRVVATLISVVMCGEVVTWAHGGDDPGCDPSPLLLLSHKAPSFTTEKTPTPTPEQHCLLCHMLRLLNMALSATPAAASMATGVGQQYLTEVVPTVSQLSLTVPTRGPPAELL